MRRKITFLKTEKEQKFHQHEGEGVAFRHLKDRSEKTFRSLLYTLGI